MKSSIRYFAFYLTVLCVFSTAAYCDPTPSKAEVSHYTGYNPHWGGINGHCHVLNSGYNPCSYPIEAGNAIFGAVPQHGADSRLYCGSYQSSLFGRTLWLGDHYGDRESRKWVDVSFRTNAGKQKIANKSEQISSSQPDRLTKLGKIPGAHCTAKRRHARHHRRHRYPYS